MRMDLVDLVGDVGRAPRMVASWSLDSTEGARLNQPR
jgi:hypothetical protein